jgi:hypothetical protein
MYMAVQGGFTYNLPECCIFSTLLTKTSVCGSLLKQTSTTD